jgi:16S rRNA processing protein RimM
MIAVGRITKSVGIKGEFRVAMLTDSPERFAKLKAVWCGADEKAAVRYPILSMRIEPSSVVLKLKGIDSRTLADKHRGEYLFVETKDVVAPAKGSYFIHDIIGMKVVTEAGEVVGSVRDVLELPANDVWVVASGTKEFLIPAIKEVIRQVDLNGRTVVIRPLEGMLE